MVNVSAGTKKPLHCCFRKQIKPIWKDVVTISQGAALISINMERGAKHFDQDVMKFILLFRQRLN
jgi:hypothetical protein